MFHKKTPLEKEWEKLVKQEQIYLDKRKEKQDSKLNLFLSEKIPNGLQSTLEEAFYKAFSLIFEKGTGLIEKTYNREKIDQEFRIQEYTEQVKKNRKSLRAFSKQAKQSKMGNTLLSAISGIGLGILGIGLPDIAIFTSLLLKSVYEISLHYGYDYNDEQERRFILLIIEGALSYGKQAMQCNEKLNMYIETETFGEEQSMEVCMRKTACCLSTELLYMKFLQGIPVVGAIGGAYDVVYMNQVTTYAELKYRRRLYLKKLKITEE